MSVNIQNFEKAKEKIIGVNRERKTIGVLSEKTVHAVLKNYYEPDENHQEIPVEGMVADIYRDGNIIEIQTAHFDKLREKLARFLPYYDVTVVYPVPACKWLIWVDELTGECAPKRKSPLKGTPYMIFKELYKIKSYLRNENLHFKIAMLDIEEYRLLNGWSRNRKKGSTRFDRMPVEFKEEYEIYRIEDYMQFLPIDLPESFTTADLAKCAGIPVGLARIAMNIISYVGGVDKNGKRGNAIVYEING